MHFFFYFINMIKRSTLFCFAGRMYTIVSFNIIFECHRHPGLVLPSITTPSFSQNPKKSERGKEREREREREGERESFGEKKRGTRGEERRLRHTDRKPKEGHTHTYRERKDDEGLRCCRDDDDRDVRGRARRVGGSRSEQLRRDGACVSGFGKPPRRRRRRRPKWGMGDGSGWRGGHARKA